MLHNGGVTADGALIRCGFEPLFRRYLWGGRRLATSLGKALGPGHDWAESWEICDHAADQSRVEFGPLAGTSLGELSASAAPSYWAGIIRSRVSRCC